MIPIFILYSFCNYDTPSYRIRVGRNSQDSEKRAAGRPRDAAAERRIRASALQLLAEQGYSRMTLDEVAQRAGVSKPTIYRRWKGKEDLATAALRTLQLAEPQVNASTSRGALVSILQNYRRSLLRPNGVALIGTVLAEAHHTPELLRLFRRRVVAPRRRMLREVLIRATVAGELRRGVNPAHAAHLLIGAFYAHYLQNPHISPRYPEEVVNLVWNGIARP